MSQIQWIKDSGTKQELTGHLFKLAVLAELPEHDTEPPCDNPSFNLQHAGTAANSLFGTAHFPNAYVQGLYPVPFFHVSKASFFLKHALLHRSCTL